MADQDARDQLLDLLAAIGEHADLPMPGITDSDIRAHSRLATDRTRRITTAIRFIREEGHTPSETAAWLRQQAAENPATYTQHTPVVTDGDA